MATPHIAGLVATIIGRDGNSSPANISTTIQTLSTKGELTGIREYWNVARLCPRSLTYPNPHAASGTVNDIARTES